MTKLDVTEAGSSFETVEVLIGVVIVAFMICDPAAVHTAITRSFCSL